MHFGELDYNYRDSDSDIAPLPRLCFLLILSPRSGCLRYDNQLKPQVASRAKSTKTKILCDKTECCLGRRDITYIWTEQDWLYLATVIDLYSRKIKVWIMGERITTAA